MCIKRKPRRFNCKRIRNRIQTNRNSQNQSENIAYTWNKKYMFPFDYLFFCPFIDYGESSI